MLHRGEASLCKFCISCLHVYRNSNQQLNIEVGGWTVKAYHKQNTSRNHYFYMSTVVFFFWGGVKIAQGHTSSWLSIVSRSRSCDDECHVMVASLYQSVSFRARNAFDYLLHCDILSPSPTSSATRSRRRAPQSQISAASVCKWSKITVT